MDQSSSGRNHFVGFIGASFACAGLCMACLGFTEVYRGYRSYRWPSTSGVIISSSVQFLPASEDSIDKYFRKIAYEYEVQKNWLQGDRIRFGEEPGSSYRSYAAEWVAKHGVGAAVTVYYDPDNPAEAVLERGISVSSLQLPALGAIFLGVGSTMVAYWLLRPSRIGGAAGPPATSPGRTATGLDVEEVTDEQRLILRERSSPRGALVVAIVGLLIATVSVLNAVQNWPAIEYFPSAFFVVLSAIILFFAFMMLTDHETVFDRSTRRIIKIRRFYKWSHSSTLGISGYTTIRWEKVITTTKDNDGVSTSTSHPVSLEKRDMSQPPGMFKAQSSKIFDAASSEQAREFTRIVGEFLGLEQEEGGERLVDNTGRGT